MFWLPEMNRFDQNRTGVQVGNRGTKGHYNIYTLVNHVSGVNIGLWAAISLIARFHLKNCDLIEKKVSERTAKLSRHDVVSPFFLPPRSVLINTSGQQFQRDEHWSVGCDIIDCTFAPKYGNLTEKRVSDRTVKLLKHNVSHHSFGTVAFLERRKGQGSGSSGGAISCLGVEKFQDVGMPNHST